MSFTTERKGMNSEKPNNYSKKINLVTALKFGEIYIYIYIYRVSQEEWTKLRESVPYVKIYRYNPKHLCPKLNGYGDKGAIKVWSSCGSTFCTWFA